MASVLVFVVVSASCERHDETKGIETKGVCDIPGTEKRCGFQPQELLFFTLGASVNLLLVK